MAEKIEDNSDGTVFNFMATMEYKHKSEGVTQQEARRIRSIVLKEQKVAVLNLLINEDVELFRSAIPNIDYRCQVIHECVTCITPSACFAVATTKLEFVLIVLVPTAISSAYTSFTNAVRRKYLDWLFKPGTNEFDQTLSRMPRYRAKDIVWGYAKDDETVRCRLGVMMALYALRKEQGHPLLPSDGLVPMIVSRWNIGKGPIDDMSQVLASCLPAFGPINGMCWIWIRTWMMMTFNAWRLNAMNASSGFVLSEACITRKKLLAARSYHGKTFLSFLKILYDSMEMPELLRGTETESGDNPLSPIRPQKGKGKVTYEMWAQEEAWVDFRTTPHPGHVPSNLRILVQQKFISGSAEKRKRKVVDGVDGEQIVQMDQTTEAVPDGRFPDNRRWCFRCTYKIRLESVGGGDKPKNVSRLENSKPKKTINFCMRREVALCQDCFRP